jgi:hypothetical protein
MMIATRMEMSFGVLADVSNEQVQITTENLGRKSIGFMNQWQRVKLA